MQERLEALFWAPFGQMLHRKMGVNKWAVWVFLPKEENVTAKFPVCLQFERKGNIKLLDFLQ